MAEITSILRAVAAPELTSPGYGQAVNTQFENINANFEKLANRDFVKGESGQNLELVKIRVGVPRPEDTDLVINIEKIKTAIRELFHINSNDDARLGSVGDHNWDEGLNNKFIHVYRIMDGDTYKYAFSEPLIFRDMRWAEIDDDNIDNYAGIIDTSCVVYVDTDESPYEFGNIKFKAIASAPSLYYEDGEFKWRINGEESGILARGPEGSAGAPGKTYILKAERQQGTEECKVTAVYQYNVAEDNPEYADWIPIAGHELVVGQPAIVVVDSDKTNNNGDDPTTGYNCFYLSTIRSYKVDGETIYAVTCVPNINGVPLTFDDIKFNILLGGISDNSAMTGLFLPISAESYADVVGNKGSRAWVNALSRHVIESSIEPSAEETYKNILTIKPVKGKNGDTPTDDFDIVNAALNINYPRVSFTNPSGVKLSHGINAQTTGFNSHAEGQGTIAYGTSSHAEGTNTTAKGSYSHAEGYGTTAEGNYSHAEGYRATAKGVGSHAEGANTYADGNGSHAEGTNTTAKGSYSHAEGQDTYAKGSYSHAEGIDTHADGSYSHAEGYRTTAEGEYSHVTGSYNVAKGKNSTLQGYYLFDHGIDTKNSFIWLQYSDEGPAEDPSRPQIALAVQGCGFIEIGEQYLVDPEHSNNSNDPRKNYYRVSGVYFEKPGHTLAVWTQKVTYDSSDYEYYISAEDLNNIIDEWTDWNPDSKHPLTPEFTIWKYPNSGSGRELSPVAEVRGCGWIDDKSLGKDYDYEARVNAMKNDKINRVWRAKDNRKPYKFTNDNATIVGKYNKPQQGSIFEVGCGSYSGTTYEIEQCNAISVAPGGETTIPELITDSVTSESVTSDSVTSGSVTSDSVTTWKIIVEKGQPYPNNTISNQIDAFGDQNPDWSEDDNSDNIKGFICRDGILFGCSNELYMYLKIDGRGHIILGNCMPGGGEQRKDLSSLFTG